MQHGLAVSAHSRHLQNKSVTISRAMAVTYKNEVEVEPFYMGKHPAL